MNLNDILLSDDIVLSINNNLDYLLEIMPELRFMMGFEHKHPHHHLDVWNHTLLALSLSPKDFDIRLVLLLHDIGKPFSYQDEEVRHFKNHNIVSANISKEILRRLNFEDDYVLYIHNLIIEHDNIISDKLINEDYEFCQKLYEIQKCDALAHHPDKLEKRIEYLNKTKEKILSLKKNN